MDTTMVGRRLRSARRAQDLTQHQLGTLSQVSYTTISRIEKGHHQHIYATTMAALAEALHISLDWLYGRKETCDV